MRNNHRVQRESETRLQALSDATFEGIAFTERGVVVDVNQQMAEMLGYKVDELRGLKVSQFVAPEDRELVREKILAGVKGPYGHRALCKDGSVIFVEARARMMEIQGRMTRVTAVRDISERKRAEAEREGLLAQVREQAQQVEEIIDTVPHGVLLLDAEYRVLLANPKAREYLAELADVGVGDTLSALFDRPMSELLTSPPQGLWHEVEVAGSPRRIFETIGRPLEGGPKTNGWVLVLRDVTEQREIRQRAQQQERLAAVGQLAAGIAHDFKNNLAVITLYSQMLQRSPNLSPRERERLAIVAEQAKQAADLTTQILDFSRRSVLEQRTLDLAPFLQELAKLLERTLKENVRVELLCGSDEYVVNADPTRLQQMLMNLAINARDAMPEGGELRISLERVQDAPAALEGAHLSADGIREGSDDWVKLTVADSGAGISPAALPHIFEPFFTTKPRGEGTGLGLAQVWGIVQQHQGHIGVSSKEGEGTIFTVYLPAMPALRQDIPTEKMAALPTGRGEIILVVEDNAAMRAALVESLEGLNYRALTASNGREASAILDAHADDSITNPESPIALVLSDMVMPEMGGQALFHELKQQDSNVKIVLLTGHRMDERLEGLRAQGLDGWLAKPPNLAQLAQVVSQALEKERIDG
jgi:PAS domain S-box-containing protein